MLSGMTRFSGPCQPALSSCSTMRFLAHGRFVKVGKDELEQFLADGVGDVPHRPACRRLDEACHIEPLEPMVAECDRPLADRRPHAPHDRFQTDAMFIHRPDFNARAWVLAPFLVSRGRKLFLSAARSASVAASGGRGRGRWIEYPIAISASHPR